MRPVSPRRDRTQLQQIVSGVSEGIIIIDPDRTIVWANDAALAMHGADQLPDLGKNVETYRKRFRLRYRNNHPLSRDEYPSERVIAGEVPTVTEHSTAARPAVVDQTVTVGAQDSEARQTRVRAWRGCLHLPQQGRSDEAAS